VNVVFGAGPLGLAVARLLVSIRRPVQIVCLSCAR
jgi:threonine dehydrogenase-like Zn-dependent dehydrogenase